jgi:hypothetical protein
VKLFNVPISFGYGGGYSALVFADTIEDAIKKGNEIKEADKVLGVYYHHNTVAIYGNWGFDEVTKQGYTNEADEIKFEDGYALLS